MKFVAPTVAIVSIIIVSRKAGIMKYQYQSLLLDYAKFVDCVIVKITQNRENFSGHLWNHSELHEMSATW